MIYDIFKELVKNDVMVYAMTVLGTIGVLSSLLSSLLYRRLIKASADMGNSKHKLMKSMCLRFETCYKLKIGVHNVDSFVDKYVYRHKFCGILLYTWERICGQAIAACLAITIIFTFLGYYYDCGKDMILFTLGLGISVSTMLIAFQVMLDLNKKKDILATNISDYLENYLKAKLENEYFSPEELEQYRNAYFNKTEDSEDESDEAIKTIEAESDAEKERILEEVLREYLA
ncbi:hypothetical protein [Velocimicrobium porci]|mgnify:CR=1 FL=1|uniref:Uncharacterized protein n=1 Tax=Velocimicrobium porci TaxID=2606634 RepID=A0A6L5XXA3_9FIRM|nr:hypothetical protein [Velocimicrobium porci]MSS63239.1 hypothetical protein [Velocimicrobium porci]